MAFSIRDKPLMFSIDLHNMARSTKDKNQNS